MGVEVEVALLAEEGKSSGPAPQTRADFIKGCWVLFIFSFSAALQALLWILPGTISTSLAAAYAHSFGPNTVQHMFIIGSFAFFPATVAAEFAMERFGLRVCTITNVLILTGIATLRCAAQTDSSTSLALWMGSAVLVGLSGPMTMALPGYLAELWFTPAQRATATAVAVEAATVGSSLGYLLPGLLPQNSIADLNRVYVLCLCLCVANLAFCVYFPAAPTAPPSRSAAAADTADAGAHGTGRPPVTLASVWLGVRDLAGNSQFVIVVLVYGVILGFNGAWSTTLNLNLSRAGLSEDYAGYIGFSGMMLGNLVGLFAGRLADRFHRMKAVLLTLLAANVAALVVFSAAAQPIFRLSPSASLGVLWAAAVLSNSCVYGSIPIFFELCLEAAFPAHASLVLFAAVTANNLANVSLLFVPVSSAAVAFNWAYTGGCALASLSLAFCYRERLKRLEFDAGGGGGDEGASGAAFAVRPGIQTACEQQLLGHRTVVDVSAVTRCPSARGIL